MSFDWRGWVDDVVGENLGPIVRDGVEQAKPELRDLGVEASLAARMLGSRLDVLKKDASDGLRAIEAEADPAERGRMKQELQASLERSRQYLGGAAVAFGETATRRAWDVALDVVVKVLVAVARNLI